MRAYEVDSDGVIEVIDELLFGVAHDNAGLAGARVPNQQYLHGAVANYVSKGTNRYPFSSNICYSYFIITVSKNSFLSDKKNNIIRL